jgi:hypothetical protein
MSPPSTANCRYPETAGSRVFSGKLRDLLNVADIEHVGPDYQAAAGLLSQSVDCRFHLRESIDGR